MINPLLKNKDFCTSLNTVYNPERLSMAKQRVLKAALKYNSRNILKFTQNTLSIAIYIDYNQ
jgi:hypothetical protein